MKQSLKIIEILTNLAADDKIPMDLSELSPEHFQCLDREVPICGFTREDIHETCHNMDEELTNEEIESVHFRMGKQFDANHGMTWGGIESHIQDVINERS